MHYIFWKTRFDQAVNIPTPKVSNNVTTNDQMWEIYTVFELKFLINTIKNTIEKC